MRGGERARRGKPEAWRKSLRAAASGAATRVAIADQSCAKPPPRRLRAQSACWATQAPARRHCLRCRAWAWVSRRAPTKRAGDRSLIGLRTLQTPELRRTGPRTAACNKWVSPNTPACCPHTAYVCAPPYSHLVALGLVVLPTAPASEAVFELFHNTRLPVDMIDMQWRCKDLGLKSALASRPVRQRRTRHLGLGYRNSGSRSGPRGWP